MLWSDVVPPKFPCNRRSLAKNMSADFAQFRSKLNQAGPSVQARFGRVRPKSVEILRFLDKVGAEVELGRSSSSAKFERTRKKSARFEPIST